MGGLGSDQATPSQLNVKLPLDESNSKVYRAKAEKPRHARIEWNATHYRLTWGDQTFDEPHMRILDPDGHYGVDLKIFFETHQPLPDTEHHYLKIARVRAARVVADFQLVTFVKSGIEMTAEVPAGAMVVQNPSGECYAMPPEEFEARYAPEYDV